MNGLTIISLTVLFAFASARSLDIVDDNSDSRIVNGKDAALGQFPHQVSLRFRPKDKHMCGGTILSSRFILTAAHCPFALEKMFAHAGSVELSNGGKFYNISQRIPHPLYDANDMKSLRNDIALWRTSEEIQFDDNVQPAALPTKDTPANVSLNVSGWGYTKYPPPQPSTGPNNLQFLKTTSMSATECKNAFENWPSVINGNDFDKIICVFERGAGACRGDSGGPLAAENKVVVGVVNWGIPCAKGLPDGFARVYSFLDFIKKTMSAQYDD